MVERTSGEKQLSDQSIQNTVVNKALEISKQVEFEASNVLEDDTLGLPEINFDIDIYDVNTKFVIIFVDGIGVKKQSESRASLKNRVEADSETESAGSRVNSNVVLTPKKSG